MKSVNTTQADDYENILDRARSLMKYFPAFGEHSVMSKLVNSGVDQSIAFFAIRGAQVLELQLSQVHPYIKK